MKLRGRIQATATSELTAEASDIEGARALIEEQVPHGYELLQVHNTMPRSGRVIETAIIRPATVREIEAAGVDYSAARAALREAIPEGYRLLSISIEE